MVALMHGGIWALVRGGIGALVHWCMVALGHWGIGALVHWALVQWGIGALRNAYCTYYTHYTYPQLEGHDEVDVVLVPECRQLHKVTVDVLVVIVLVLVRVRVRVRVGVRVRVRVSGCTRRRVSRTTSLACYTTTSARPGPYLEGNVRPRLGVARGLGPEREPIDALVVGDEKGGQPHEGVEVLLGGRSGGE